MSQSARIKKLVIRYAWAGPIIGFIFGILFGPGVVGQIIDFRIKSHSVHIEQLKLEKEFFEKIQSCQAEILLELKNYFSLRDQLYQLQVKRSMDDNLEKKYWSSLKEVQELVKKYNQLEDLYSSVNGKPAKYFVFSNYYQPLNKLQPPVIIGIFRITNDSKIPTGQSSEPPKGLFFLMEQDPILGSITNLYKMNDWQNNK